MDIILLSSKDQHVLIRYIKKQLDEGWIMQGGISVVNTSSGQNFWPQFFQTMIKNDLE